MFALNVTETFLLIGLSFIPVEMPKPGTLLKLNAEFMYMLPSGVRAEGTKRFERGQIFLLVTSVVWKKPEQDGRSLRGGDIVKLTLLGSDNRLWERAVTASVLYDDFEVVGKCA